VLQGVSNQCYVDVSSVLGGYKVSHSYVDVRIMMLHGRKFSVTRM